MAKKSRKTLEQGRAAFAYSAAVKGADLSKISESKAREYKSYVKKLPTYIKTNGLGAAMSFCFAKGKGRTTNAWGLLYSQITNWLKVDEKQLLDIKDDNLMKALTEADSSVYRATTIEVLALLNWMRRFAEGLITKD